MLGIALFTIAQAAGSTLVAAAVGLVAAFFTARRSFLLRGVLLSLASVPLCLPALIMALGYVTVFGMSGVANRLLTALLGLREPPITFLYTAGGLVIAQGFYNFPLVMATVGDTWARLPTDEADCARLLGASEARIFRTITLPQLSGAIVSACIPVFLFCFFSFMLVLLFGGVGCTTLEVEIYRALRGKLDFARAARLAAAETFVALAVVILHGVLEHRTKRGIRGSEREREPITGLCERVCFAVFVLTVSAFFVTPFICILWNALTTAQGQVSLQTFAHVLRTKSFMSALLGTLATAAATGCCCALLAFSYAVFVRERERQLGACGKLLLRTLPMLPMAVSSVVVGMLLIALVRQGNAALLVAAQTVLYVPFAFRQLHAQLSKLPDDTLDAARLFARHPLATVVGVYLPCSVRGLLSAAGFCFAMSAGDTTLPLVLAIPRFNTLALFTYRFAGSYRFNEACAVGLLLTLLCVGVFATANALKEKPARRMTGAKSW